MMRASSTLDWSQSNNISCKHYHCCWQCRRGGERGRWRKTA